MSKRKSSGWLSGGDSAWNLPDLRPIPDPTVQTTQQLSAAINSLRDLYDTRFEAMNRIIGLHETLLNRSPTVGEVFVKSEEHFAQIGQRLSDRDKRMEEKFKAFDQRFDNLADIAKERFKHIEQSFHERDKRSDQLTLATTTAATAALQAQKEAASETQRSSAIAIAKAETATSESIKQLQVLFQTSISALNTQILDVKSRLDKGEGAGVGRGAATDDYRYEQGARREAITNNHGLVFGIIGSIVGAGALLTTLILNIAKSQSQLPSIVVPGITH